MPIFQNKEFPYTAAGKKAAKEYAKKTGEKPIVKKKRKASVLRGKKK